MSKKEQVLEAIKNAGEEGILGSEIADKLGVTESLVRYHLSNLISEDPFVGYKKEGKFHRYFYSTREETMDKVPNKNPEGYSDPTASRAVNLTLKNQDETIKVGGIYDVGGTDPFLVMLVCDDTIVGYYVYESDFDETSDYEQHWPYTTFSTNGSHTCYCFVRVNWIMSMASKKIKRYLRACPFTALQNIKQKGPLSNAQIIEVTTEVPGPVETTCTIPNVKCTLSPDKFEFTPIPQKDLDTALAVSDLYKEVYHDLIDVLKGWNR